MTQPILLFDGVCNVCNSTAAFVMKRDPSEKVSLASLQSPEGQSLLNQFGLPAKDFTSLVFIKNDHVFVKSAAVVELLVELPFPWPAIARLISIVPNLIRDLIYDGVARNRYRWFGKTDVCVIDIPRKK